METNKNIPIELLGIDDMTKEILTNAGYCLVSDLISARVEDVEALFNIPKTSYWGYDGYLAFRRLKSLLHHDLKVTFSGEYDAMGLTPEAANTPVSQLELPVAIKNVLMKQLSAYTFGDLLTTDYKRIVGARNFGETYLKVLKDYIHGLGYTLKGEEPTLKEILTTLRNEGVHLLEEVIPDAGICTPLYKSGIYTVDDLLNFGPAVNELAGFGPLRQQRLAEKMKELNLSFYVSPVQPEETVGTSGSAVAIRPTDAIITHAKIENDAIRARIEQKENLISEYDSLMEERRQLLIKEGEIDLLIAAKLNDMKNIQAGDTHGKK